MLRTTLKAAVAFVAVATALALLGAWWVGRSGRPLRQGEATLAGLSDVVTVRWSAYGVPHLNASRATDLAAAMGYVHANDRFVQLELGRRLSSGRLAEIVGDVALPSDRYFLSLGLPRWARAKLDALGEESRALLEAYAQGVNAWIAERRGDLPPELVLLGVDPEPWTPVDSLYFQLQLSHSLSFWQGRPEEERFRWFEAIGPRRLTDLLGPPALHIPDGLVTFDGQTPPPGVSRPADAQAWTPGWPEHLPAPGSLGSNNWAIGGSRTATGTPIIANDPHLPLALPGVWYQAQMRADDYQASGMTLPGFPFVVIGQGPDIAWGFTNVMLDDHDLFFERLNADGKRVLRGEEWMEIESESLPITHRDGTSETLTVRYTDIGVLLEADPRRGMPARSLAWTAATPGDEAAVFVSLARASRVQDLVGELDRYISPAQNLVAADRHGGLLYTALGRVPNRRQGDGRLPAPAWNPEYHWDGLLPQRDNPTRLNPPDDLLVTANNDIQVTAVPTTPPFTADFDTPHRADRIGDLLRRRDNWEVPQLRRVQTDISSLYARELVAMLEADYDGDAARAHATLVAWDGAMVTHGPAALFALLERELLVSVFADEAAAFQLPRFGGRRELLRLLAGDIPPEWFDDIATAALEGRGEILRGALARAWVETVKRWGSDPDGWDYGQLHPLRLDHPLAAVPLLGSWLSRGPIPMPGSSTTVAAFGGGWRGDSNPVAYGPSMRWIADPADGDNSLAVLPAGQSGHPADQHYDDQLVLYLSGQLHPVYWSEAAIEANTTATLRLLPSQ